MSDSQPNEEPRESVDDSEPAAPGVVTDEDLPEDLQPSEENPLARHPEQSGDEDDRIGADREGDPDTAPLTAEDADYGSGGSGDSDSSD